MAMTSAASHDSQPFVEMNTTPLIDVLLVLLIMFIITLPVLTHSTMLQSGRATGEVPPVVTLEIEFDGTVYWNGRAIAGLDELESLFRAEALLGTQPDLQVLPDGRAPYDAVAKVLALAQRSGMQRIGVGTRD